MPDFFTIGVNFLYILKSASMQASRHACVEIAHPNGIQSLASRLALVHANVVYFEGRPIYVG